MLELIGRMMFAGAVWAVSCCVAWLPADALAEQEEGILDRFGFARSADDLRRCLRSFTPDKAAAAAIEGFIGQLGDKDFFVRQRATEALLRYPIVPNRLLRKAAESTDLEVSSRAQRILLRRPESDLQELLAAVLEAVRDERISGLAVEILAALEAVDDFALREPAVEALAATAVEADAGVLRRGLGKDSPLVRATAVAVLSQTLREEAAPAVKPLLGDADERVRLAAALAVGDFGDRACLKTFAELLDSRRMDIRLSSVQALRFMTGQKFAYSVGASADQRAKAVADWSAWIGGPGKSAPLRFPIELSGEIALLADAGFDGWKMVLAGRVIDPGKLGGRLTIEDGTLRCAAGVRGYLRTEQAFTDYRLTVEWRWPENQFNDSGILLMLTGADSATGNALEVQLHNGNAGDFYSIGRFPACECRTGVRSRLADSSEKPRGQWNRMEIHCNGGVVTVEINGVLQNKASGCPTTPGRIGMKLENYPIEFGNMLLLPLD